MRIRASDIAWSVLLPALGLAVVGMLFIWSTTHVRDPDRWMRQLLYVGVGLACIPVVMRFGVGRLTASAYPAYAIVLAVLMAMPLLAAGSHEGSDRWIRLGFGFKLQPSEFMKVAMVLALARYLQHRGVTNTWRSYLQPFLLMAVPWFFVVRQPDLGSSIVLLPLFLVMVTVSGARAKHVALAALAAAVLLPAAYLTPGVLKPYQKDRLDAYLTPVPSLLVEAREQRQAREHESARRIEQDISRLKRGTGYQQFYSVVAIGSGGLAGSGLGRGIQNRGNRLPVRHADFIFAVIGEEWGLAGTTLVLALYAALVSAILGVAWRTREPFGRLVCVGAAGLIGAQALMNLGITTGMLPVTGLPLPLVSYGGSSVLSTFVALACVLEVARSRVTVFFES